MKLKLDRSTFLSLLVILSLSSCGESNGGSKTSTPNLQTTNPSASTNSERFLFMRDGKFGYIDRTGKIVIPAKFDFADDFSEGLAGVGIGERYGYIDATGKFVIPPHVGYPYKFKNGLAKVIVGDKTRTIDRTGKVVTNSVATTTSETTQPDRDRLVRFEQNNKYGYKDRAGKIVIPAQFELVADRFVEGIAWVELNDRVGYINDRGKTIASPQFDYGGAYGVGEFDRGWARVCKASKCGYIDKTGKVVIPLKFDDAAMKFSEGLAWVKIDKKLGYIDKTGNVVIPARYDYPRKGKGGMEVGISKCQSKCFSASANFDRGLAAVVIPGTCRILASQACDRLGYIDRNGKSVFEF